MYDQALNINCINIGVLILRVYIHISIHTFILVVLAPILSRVEAHSSSCDEFEAWLDEKEAGLTECGPIGADLKRLTEQSELLKVCV